MLKDGPIWALGAMSGTSLDGVDAALVLTDGVTIDAFSDTAYRPYGDDERDILRAALGKWDGAEAAGELVETAHAELLLRFSDAELVGFHGQTVAHDPGGRGTRQIGDGSIMAEVLGLPVISDFRNTDVEMGGQGAPLASFYHFALAKHIGADAPLAFLNLGGVGNVTWVDPSCATPDTPGALLAFDTGPANAPIDDLMRERRGKPFDENGDLAASGTVSEAILEQFLQDPYFFQMPPKSLDRDDFAALRVVVKELSDVDAAATLTAAVAASVVQGVEYFPAPVERIVVCGGGRKNRVLMEMLQAGMGCPVISAEDVGLDGDMIEAQAFAYLAVRVARG
ncbi:MAG: anhydro-N-acetylmuramic acid kinase, partial [Marinosulfonomonas sp.]|nr:anhydro-N-acetylmuramic acid kinase [Marinosulfonomonas sp.]